MSALVSICIPTYNRPHLLAKSVEAALRQTYEPYEVIVMDNHTEPDVRPIIESFNDRRLRYYSNDTNIGIVANWNRCLQLAQGEYISICQDDDELLPDFITESLALFQQYPQIGVTCGGAYRVSEASDKSILWLPSKVLGRSGLLPRSFALAKLLEMRFVLCSSVMLRAAVVQTVGLFDERLRYAFDWHYWLRIVYHFDMAVVDKPLYKLRWHESSDTSSLLKAGGFERGLVLAVLDIADRYPTVSSAARRSAKRIVSEASRIAVSAAFKGQAEIAFTEISAIEYIGKRLRLPVAVRFMKNVAQLVLLLPLGVRKFLYRRLRPLYRRLAG